MLTLVRPRVNIPTDSMGWNHDLSIGGQSASFLDDSQDKFYHSGRIHSLLVADGLDLLSGCCLALVRVMTGFSLFYHRV